jgi:hypothetical protein
MSPAAKNDRYVISVGFPENGDVLWYRGLVCPMFHISDSVYPFTAGWDSLRTEKMDSGGESGEDSASGSLVPFIGVTVMEELSSCIEMGNRIKAPT